MVSVKYFPVLLLLLSVGVVFAADGSSNSNNTDSKSNETKISWYSDKNKDKSEGDTEKVQQKSDDKKEEKVQSGSLSEGNGKGNVTKESGKDKGGKDNKDLTLEELLKTIEGDKVSKSNQAKTKPESDSGYRNKYDDSDMDFDNYPPPSFPYTPFHPEEPYNPSYDDYPPMPPPYPYSRFPPQDDSSEVPSTSQNYDSDSYNPSYFPDEYQIPASWFDPNFFPDETFDDANHLYSDDSYASPDTDMDKRYPKSVHPLDMVYNLNEPVFLDKPCACSGFLDDTNTQYNTHYKRHALPPPPFGPKADDEPLKLKLPKPQWITKLKQLHEEKKQKLKPLEVSHVKSRSADEEESPLPVKFFQVEESDEDTVDNVVNESQQKEDGEQERDSFFS